MPARRIAAAGDDHANAATGDDHAHAAPGGTVEGERSRSARAVLVALGVAAFAYAFQQTGVLPAIPTIEHQFHASAAWAAWPG